MSIEHTIRLFAGTLIITGLALGWYVHPAWLLLVAFVGINLIQSAFTKWCLAESLLSRFVYRKTS